MEEKEIKLQIDETEQELIKKTEAWNASDTFGIIPYIAMALLQVCWGIKEDNFLYICFSMFTLASLNTHLFHIKELKHKQAIFNIVCGRLYKYMHRGRKKKEEK